MRDAFASEKAPLGGAFLFLLAYFVVDYARPQEFISVLRHMKPGLLLTLILGLIWWRYSDKSELRDPLILLSLAFATLAGLGLIYATNKFWVFQTSKQLFLFLQAGVLPAILLIDSPERMRRFFRWWIGIHVFVAGHAIIKNGVGPGGFLGDENDLALAVNMAIPYAYFQAVSKRNAVALRCLYALATGVFMAAVIISASRGGFVGMVFVFLAIILVSKHRVRMFIGVALVSLVALSFVPESYKAEVQSIDNAEDSTREDRLWTWKMAMKIFADYPILGVGVTNFRWRVEAYELNSPEFDPETMKLHGGRAAHSLYFGLLSETGLSGALIFSSLTAALWFRIRKLQDFAVQSDDPGVQSIVPILMGMSASLVGYLSCGLFISVLYYPHIWYLAGFAVAATRIIGPLSKRCPNTNASKLVIV